MTCGHCGVLLPAAPTGRPARYCSPAHKQAAYRARLKVKRRPVLAAMGGTNADLLREVVRLLRIGDGATVADVTYGRGSFWARTEVSRFRMARSNIRPRVPGVLRADFRRLPYRDASIDVLVLDPPYAHHPDTHALAAGQYNGATAAGLGHDQIMGLYAAGLAEAARVLRPGGVALVKCQPEVESGRVRWSDMEVCALATGLGMTAADRFTLVRKRPPSPPGRWDRQLHARRNESVLWVFRNETRRTDALRNEVVSVTARRARSAGICPLCGGPVRVGDPVRAWSPTAWAHESCWLKDRDLDGGPTGMSLATDRSRT